MSAQPIEQLLSAKGGDPAEWSEIFFEGPASRPVMSVPPKVVATKKFITEVRDALDLDDDTKATLAADWIADKMERFGASMAEPVFDMDGNGPVCSWCKVIWPLCGHQHQSVILHDDEATE